MSRGVYYSIREIAERAHCSEAFVRLAVGRGDLPFETFGRVRRVRHLYFCSGLCLLSKLRRAIRSKVSIRFSGATSRAIRGLAVKS